MKIVYISTRTLGQSFGRVGVVKEIRTHRELAASDMVRPLGCLVAAESDARAIAEHNGWHVIEAA